MYVREKLVGSAAILFSCCHILFHHLGSCFYRGLPFKGREPLASHLDFIILPISAKLKQQILPRKPRRPKVPSLALRKPITLLTTSLSSFNQPSTPTFTSQTFHPHFHDHSLPTLYTTGLLYCRVGHNHSGDCSVSIESHVEVMLYFFG